MEEFRRARFFKDSKYYRYVSLPCKVGLVENVPSNHKIALFVLNQVVLNLDQERLVSAYQELFNKTLENGIIENMKVDSKDFDSCVWVPHRPIIKNKVNTGRSSAKLRSRGGNKHFNNSLKPLGYSGWQVGLFLKDSKC